jgi:CRP/FNR family transcriptional regulator, nitrogen oxide reductase regulator
MVKPLLALPVVESSRFLAGLEKTATHAILADAKIRRFSAQHNIASKGHRATHLFLIQSGQVHYYHLTKQGESVLLARLVPGDAIGLAALLKSPSTYRADAEAASDCELLAWDHTVMRKLVSRYPLLMENGLRIGLDLLQIYAQRHIGLVTKTAEERLADALIRLSHQSGEVRPDGIEVHATNEQLGKLADISQFTVSRVLRKWARKGILSKKRGRVLLRALEALMIE